MKLDEMLGFDASDPLDRLAEHLVEEHEGLIRALVKIREDKGLEQQDVAREMGIDPSGVSRIESGARDVHLSTLRRYAFAVGATIHHHVEDYEVQLRRERAATSQDQVRTPYDWASVRDVVRSVRSKTLSR